MLMFIVEKKSICAVREERTSIDPEGIPQPEEMMAEDWNLVDLGEAMWTTKVILLGCEEAPLYKGTEQFCDDSTRTEWYNWRCNLWSSGKIIHERQRNKRTNSILNDKRKQG